MWVGAPVAIDKGNEEMALLHTTSRPYTTSAPTIGRSLKRLSVRLSRLTNGIVTRVLSETTRRLELAKLHRLSDRELKDMGVYRSQIDHGLDEVAKHRSLKQQAN